jgi:hypothetical protein
MLCGLQRRLTTDHICIFGPYLITIHALLPNHFRSSSFRVVGATSSRDDNTKTERFHALHNIV